mgnify:CR=1 FL=1
MNIEITIGKTRCVDLKIKINAGSRIHLGFIDPLGVSGRRWGSLGLYLNEPRLSIICEESDYIDVHGPEWLKDIVNRVSKSLEIKGLKVKCEEYIPRHVGLGSGTQTILSIGLAASKLYGLDLSLEDIALMFSRCKRSGAGYWLFQKGGLTIDSGAASPLKPPTLLFRLDFPKEWKVLLAIPNSEGLGLLGQAEEEGFKKLSTRPVKDASLTILMKLLPSLIEKDFTRFTESIEELDFLTSSFFKEIQSGAYHPVSERVVELFRKSGLRGIGQSSWGPTIYSFIREDEVESLTSRIKPVEGFRYVLTSARNYGAEITEL